MTLKIQILILIKRVLNLFIQERNKQKVKDAKDNPANTIANNGRLHKSDKTFSDISRESERDSTE